MPVGGMRVDVNVAACNAVARGAAVARDLTRRAETVTQEAKRLCPVSPDGSHGQPSGFLRNSISWKLGEDGLGLYADIGTDVWYALFPELGTGPHVIESHGDYPLRNAKGQTFGRKVNHPGTQAQPYLRPSLMAGRI